MSDATPLYLNSEQARQVMLQYLPAAMVPTSARGLEAKRQRDAGRCPPAVQVGDAPNSPYRWPADELIEWCLDQQPERVREVLNREAQP